MQWSRYLTPEATWEAMHHDIEAAQHAIDCESYILKPDATGTALLEALKKKAQAGLRVRLLCDAVGSYSLFTSKIPNELRTAGVQVRFFNPIRTWRIDTFTSWFFRDHRKILVIDEHIGYTGGVGFQEGMRGWRDTHVRVEGTIVSDMAHAFDVVWQGIEHHPHPLASTPRMPGAENKFLESAPVIHHGRRGRQNFIYRDFVDAIMKARSYIYFTTPYFVPPLRLLRAIRAAARRKVDVRLLVPQSSDHRTIDDATHSYFGTLLRAGVHVFAYQSSVLHAKTAVSDDTWASVGSANLDNLSLFFNYEANIATSDVTLISALKQDFLNDCAHAEEITRVAWKHRPPLQKARELFTWPFHGIF